MARSSACGRAPTSTSMRTAGSPGSSRRSARPTGWKRRRSAISSTPIPRPVPSISRPRRTARWGTGRCRPGPAWLSTRPSGDWRRSPTATGWGGCSLPHLRRAVKSALLTAERLEGQAGGRRAWCTRDDVNGDGLSEILLGTPELSLTLHPERGGTLTEIGWKPRALDVADVLTRRPEVYHEQVKARGAVGDGVRTIHDARPAKEAGLDALLAYDRFRRASLLDGLFPAGDALDPVEPWAGAHQALGDASMACRIATEADRASASLSVDRPNGYPCSVQKTVSVGGARIDVQYRVRWLGDEPFDGRWAVQWNLALTAGDAPGRYLRLADRPALRSRGGAEGLYAI